jgi:hypothetical protein
LKSWNNFPLKSYDIQALSSSQALSIPLWSNEIIQDNHLPINHPSWSLLPRNQIICLRDIWFDDHWATPNEIKDTYYISITQEDLDFLIECIREAQINIDPNDISEEIPEVLPFNYTINKYKWDEISLPLFKDLTKKRFSLPPNCQNKWNMIIGRVLNWKKVWKIASISNVPNNVNSTFYFFLHKALPTGDFLFKRGLIDPPKCRCGEFESDVHLFWSCSISKNIWKNLQTFWNKFHPSHKINMHISTLLLPSLPVFRGNYDFIFSTLIKIALHQIWINRCQALFQNPIYTPLTSQEIIHNFKNHLFIISYSKKKKILKKIQSPLFEIVNEKIITKF